MHEYPVTLEIIRIADEYAKNNNAEWIQKINLVVGEYSGYVADSIRLYFDLIAENTSCHSAELTIRLVKPKLLCSNCHCHFDRKPFSFACPACGGEGLPTEVGREFFVESIEI